MCVCVFKTSSLKRRIKLTCVLTSRQTKHTQVQFSWSILEITMTFFNLVTKCFWLNVFSDCCKNFNCNTTVIRHNSNIYHLKLSETSLQKHDVVLLLNTSYNFSCLPSMLYNSRGKSFVYEQQGKVAPYW